MRNNGPVTGREVPVKTGEEIVSSTDTQGNIRFCNDTFCRIAGFAREEVLGEPHNILRHPDMPEEAFAQLWQALKRGKPWLGVIKNRCKNGDHYWVSAYVTPLSDGKRITGYESVRTRAEPELIARAEKAYTRLRKGQQPCPRLLQLWHRLGSTLLTALAAFAVMALLGFASDVGTGYYGGALVGALIFGGVAHWLLRQHTGLALNEARQTHSDALAAYIFTGRCDITGEIRLAQIALSARLRTALGRFRASAGELQQTAQQARLQAENTFTNIARQQQETASVAQAMQQMSLAVHEVASGATETSGATRDAIKQVQTGDRVIHEASNAITELSTTVKNLDSVLERLTEGSVKIASVVDVIRGVAEQTNLLALNAAIEAARAGEQGRGFAVVADEVRTLAQRTQESTGHIQSIIGELSETTEAAGTSMHHCLQMAERSVMEMDNVSRALKAIASAVESIDQMSHQIAAAAEEQSATATDIEDNTRTISTIAEHSQEEITQANQLNQKMARLSSEQFDLVERFN